MMRAIRLACGTLALLVLPAAAFAQDGTTPFLTIPQPLAKGQSDIGGYVSIEDNIDLFGVYRRGLGTRFDGGLRAGYNWDDGKYQVSIFSRNILNEVVAVGGIDFNNLTGFINEPRTWGVEFKGNF